MTCYMVGGQRWNAFLVGSGWCLLFSLFVGSIIRVQSILGFRASWNSLCASERRGEVERREVMLLPSWLPARASLLFFLIIILQIPLFRFGFFVFWFFFFFWPLSKTLLSSLFTLESDDLFGPNLWSCCSWVQSRTKRDLNVLFAPKKLQRCYCHSSPLQDGFLHPLLVFCPKDMN